MWSILIQTFEDFWKDECPRLAAALAYYTVLALPALLMVIVALVGLIFSEELVVQRLTDHIREATGERAAQQVEAIVRHARQPGHGWNWLAGMALLLVSATGVLQELQTALNRTWGVQPDPSRGGVRRFLIKRLLSLAMLLSAAFLLLLSLVASTLLTAFGEWIDANAPTWLSTRVISTLNTLLSLAIITLLFAAIFKFLPDAKVAWSDVWAGAAVTSLLFVAGKTALGMYLGWSDPTSAFGAAGSIVLILLWIYYSALVLLLGASFTHALARHHGRRFDPQHGARRADARQEPATRRQAAEESPGA